MQQAAKWKITHLRGFESGFGYFVGDEVIYGKKKGNIAFVYRKSRAISVHYINKAGGIDVAIFHPSDSDRIKKTGNRTDDTAFGKQILKQIYDSYSLPDKVVFLYHYNGGGREAAEKIATKLNLPFSKVKEHLKAAKEQGYL